MEEANIITHPKCTHQRVRVVFDPEGGDLDDDDGKPLVVRLDDRGFTTVMGGWKDNFDVNAVGYAWNHFGDVERVRAYLKETYESRAEFVNTPDPRTFAFVVIAHPHYVATFGGQGEEHPGEQWIAQTLAQTVKEVTAYAAGEAWKFVLDRLVAGKLIRSYADPDRHDEVIDFADWEETDEWSETLLDYDWTLDAARRFLEGSVLDCKECKRGT